MKAEAIKAVQKQLIAVGFEKAEINGQVVPLKVDGVLGPATKEAVKRFKEGYGRFSRMDRVTGYPGAAFRKALKWSFERDGKCSDHFYFREWRSKGNGTIRVHRRLVRGLEKYRAALGHPVQIVSGYRDPAYNKKVGGATSSQHMSGRAVDLVPELPLAKVKSLRRFTGIGYQSSGPYMGKVRHVDVRPLRTVLLPAIWAY